MTQPIVVIDYGASNLRSVARAVAHADAEPVVSGNFADFANAAGLILPGVGAAQDTMANLTASGLIEPIREYIAAGKPFLGVCMGLQALFEHSEEGGGQDCLGILPGQIVEFPASSGKVPHMGWNTVDWVRPHPITEGIPSGSYFYFVHSYYPAPTDASLALGVTEYGVTFPSVVARGNVVATQCHPEKSGADGLRLYANFVRWARAGAPDSTSAPAGGLR